MSDVSAVLALPYIQPSQAQKHVTHNEALRLLDVIVQLAVLDRSRTAAPVPAAVGDRHIVAAEAHGRALEWVLLPRRRNQAAHRLAGAARLEGASTTHAWAPMA